MVVLIYLTIIKINFRQAILTLLLANIFHRLQNLIIWILINNNIQNLIISKNIMIKRWAKLNNKQIIIYQLIAETLIMLIKKEKLLQNSFRKKRKQWLRDLRIRKKRALMKKLHLVELILITMGICIKLLGILGGLKKIF